MEESVSDLQPDSDISETRKSRFESQVKHILVLADSGVMTLLQWKKCQSFGLETPCTRWQFSVKIIANIYDVLSYVLGIVDNIFVYINLL